MADIFDNPILCKSCKKIMRQVLISKNGINLRALKCEKCGEILIHPVDKQEYENFMILKNKEFEVKMRLVGNSYAVSIPREIVNFMQEQEKMIDNMVRLSFEDIGKLSLNFNSGENGRVIKSKTIRIVKNNKPVLEARQFYDSAHPEKTQTKVFKAENKIKGDENERS
jgi:hypothetical protein